MSKVSDSVVLGPQLEVSSRDLLVERELRAGNQTGSRVQPGGVEDTLPVPVVGIGSIVSILFKGDLEVVKLTVVGPGHYELGCQCVRADMPLGQAILGKQPGMTVRFTVERGMEQEVTILAVVSPESDVLAAIG